MNRNIMHKNILLFVFTVALVAGGATPGLAQSSLSDFGVSEADVKSNTVNALVHGNVSIFPNRQAFKAASQSQRAAFVRDVFSVVKAHTESEAFQAEYAKQRVSAKPSAPPGPVSPDEQYAEFLAKTRKELADMKAHVAQMPSDMQKQMASIVEAVEKNYAQQVNDPAMVAMVKQSFASQAEHEQQAYNEKLSRYEKRYPADPKVLIASRLREFLELTRDIPDNAQLEPGSSGVMKFADPAFEAKSLSWKLWYRAGKEAVETARAFAGEWLKQLEQ